MKREIFDGEHQMFRDAFRRFVEREIVPHQEQWEKDGVVSREVWHKAGQQGFLGMDMPIEHGGGGVEDFRYNMIIAEELARVGSTGTAFGLHTNIVVPYITRYGNEDQKARWLPKLASGEYISAIAMTEPGTGSDLAGVRTSAIRQNGHYLLNGQKTFITNGILSDLVIVVTKTNPEARHSGISLLVVERGMPGFERGRNLEKIGMHAQDTAELFFENVEVPAENLLGEEGQGFIYLMQQLPQERLDVAMSAIAGARTALEHTIEYCKTREAFGRPIGKFQHSRFKLAEMKTEIEIGQVFVDQCVLRLNRGELTTEDAAMAKWWITDLLNRVVNQCLQLHGGYGYMLEYPIAKAYLDARVTTIYAGTNEIMKEIIGRGMGF